MDQEERSFSDKQEKVSIGYPILVGINWKIPTSIQIYLSIMFSKYKVSEFSAKKAFGSSKN